MITCWEQAAHGYQRITKKRVTEDSFRDLWRVAANASGPTLVYIRSGEDYQFFEQVGRFVEVFPESFCVLASRRKSRVMVGPYEAPTNPQAPLQLDNLLPRPNTRLSDPSIEMGVTYQVPVEYPWSSEIEANNKE